MLIGINIIPSSANIIFSEDTTPPVTTINFFGKEGENGWYVYMVDVWFTATDDLSGVNTTFYRINGGEWEIYTKLFSINYDGIHIIEFFSVDNARNVEEVKSAELKIDQYVDFIDLGIWTTGFNKCTLIATCFDYIGGIDRVEFYFDYELIYTDYEKPYEWNCTDTDLHHFSYVIAYDKAGNRASPVYTTPMSIFGIILNPKFSEYSVTFFAVIVRAHHEIFKFEKFTLNTIGFMGYIGKFLISGSYRYEWLPD